MPYKADFIQLDLIVESGEERELIVGRIFTETPDITVSGLQIEIVASGEVISKSITNALGEFVFQNLPKGNYALQVVLSDRLVKLPPLPRL
jgi:hypothetical protein